MITFENVVFEAYRRSLRSEIIFGNWKPFKNDENAFYFTSKALLFSRYLSFCHDFLVMYQNGLIKKIRFISNFIMSQPG